jgi:hypothetical protein
VTAPHEAASQFQPFELRWDHPQLSDAEVDQSGSFEWWYFDLQTQDGVSLVILFSRRNPVFATRRVSVYIEYKDPDQALHRVRNYAADQLSWTAAGDGGELRIGPHSLRVLGTDPASWRYELELRLPEAQVSLTFVPLHRGFLPSRDGSYFRHARDPDLHTSVSFSAPLMRGEGTVTVRGRTRAVHGRGYHDHPWGTRQLFFTHHEWHWARLSTDTQGVMFADVTPNPAYRGALRFLYEGDVGTFEPHISHDLLVDASQWKKDHMFGIRCPQRLVAKSPLDTWQLECDESLLDTPIYNRSRVRANEMADRETGGGWVEYFWLSPRMCRLAFLGARAQAFFWRSFPYFGR